MRGRYPEREHFSDTCSAVPHHGYAFAGWRGSERYLCAGTAPTCGVDIPASVTAHDATGYMSAEFYDQPKLVYPGALGVEWGTWSGDVQHDLIFVEDFDADGDDDVPIGAATYPPELSTGAREGAILINGSDLWFIAAAGDRPGGVHPREVPMADFNDDARTTSSSPITVTMPTLPGWSNQLLLWTADGYDDVSDRLSDDTTADPVAVPTNRSCSARRPHHQRPTA